MKNDFLNEVDSENLDIADKILEDCRNLNTDNVYDENLFKTVQNAEHSVSQKPKKIFAKASAMVACLVVLLVIGGVLVGTTLQERKLNNQMLSKISRENAETESDIADDSMKYVSNKKAMNYSEIYEKMRRVNVSMAMDVAVAENSAEKKNMSDEYSASSGTADSFNASSAQQSQNKDYYDTNEQTENVHEGDIVKTDGNYIYTLNYDEEKDRYKVIITKVDGEKLENVSEITFKKHKKYYDYFEEIYVYYDKLILIGYREENEVSVDKYATTCYAYPLSCETIIYTYDISDRAEPNLLSTNIQDGSYDTSRLSDGILYTITNKYMDDITKEKCVPSVNGKLVSCEDVYLPENIEERKYTVITSLDLEKTEDFANSIAVAGNTSTVYVSNRNIYLIAYTDIQENISNTTKGKKALKETDIKVYSNKKVRVSAKQKKKIKEIYPDAGNIYAFKNTEAYKETDAVKIIKYRYEKEAINFVAENTVDGYAFDNMLFNEKDGYLRFVTTENSENIIKTETNYYNEKGELLFRSEDNRDYTGVSKLTNNLFVLDDELQVKAEINNLAKNEEVYSARYLGDYGYFVTYENTDPLFSVDFSDIENPKIIGELKLPGFSDYLHFYTEDKLFGFGMETGRKNSKRDSLKLEMYNISNGNAKKDTKYVIEGFDYSEALDNYRAIMVDSEKEIIGFSADKGSKTYYLLFRYNGSSFEELSRVELDKDEEYYAYYGNVRGFYINDYIYVVTANHGIKIIDMKDYKESGEIIFQK